MQHKWHQQRHQQHGIRTPHNTQSVIATTDCYRVRHSATIISWKMSALSQQLRPVRSIFSTKYHIIYSQYFSNLMARRTDIGQHNDIASILIIPRNIWFKSNYDGASNLFLFFSKFILFLSPPPSLFLSIFLSFFLSLFSKQSFIQFYSNSVDIFSQHIQLT